MLLKRHFKLPPGWEAIRDQQGFVLNQPPLSHIEVKHTGTKAEQHFSIKLVEKALGEGWMSVGKGVMTLHGVGEDLKFTILRGPGYYCCHCKAALPDANLASSQAGLTIGMLHIKTEHSGAKSPDEGNPSGYENIRYYDTVLDAAQHAKYHKPTT